MMRSLMSNVAATLLHFISQWIYDGQLDDPCQEFFVASNVSVKTERLWHDKYSLRRNMVPQFITSSQASKVCHLLFYFLQYYIFMIIFSLK